MPRVDHFVGYPVPSLVTPNKPKEGEWQFGLMLEGGTTIRFYRQDVPKASAVSGEGKFIMSVTNHADGKIDIVIGESKGTNRPPVPTATIKSDQGSYSIITEDEPEIEWFPTQVDGIFTIPPENSDRLQEGPQEREEDEEVREPVLGVEEAENG